MVKARSVKRSGRIRRRLYSMPDRMVQAVGNWINDQFYGAKTLGELRTKLREIVEKDEFWNDVTQMTVLSKKLQKIMEKY